MVQQAQRLSKSRDDRFLFGVAGGLAEYFDIDPVLVRVGWVLLTVATGGIGLLVYIVMAIVTPDGRRQVSKSAAGEDAVDDLSDSVDEPDPVPALFKKAHRQEHTGHRPHRGRGHHSAQQLGCLRLDTVGHRLACGNSGPGSHNSHSIDPARYLMNAGKTRMRRRGFSLFGLLLVAIGAVLLLNTTSVLPFGIWFELVDFWPVLLVIIGAKIMLAPRWPLVGAGLVALIIVGTVTAASLTLPPYQNRGPLRVTYVEPLADTEILRLSMGFAGGRVELTSDPASISRYPRLLAADFGNRPARVIHYQTGRLTKIYLSTEGAVIEFASEDGYARDAPGSGSDGLEASFSVSGIVDWHLMVSPDVAVDLEIKAGAADLDLDLRDLKVRRLVVGAGASDIRILLPTDAGQTDVEIAAGVTDIEISVPRGVAAHITSDAFFNSTSIDTARFPDTRDGHRSPDYYNAENRVSIEIDAVAADVTIS